MSVANPLISHSKPTRDLVSRNVRGVLATLSDQMFPYASMVDYAPLPDGDVLFLLSALAEHTRYIKVNPKVSLLIAPDLNNVDAFTKSRVTLLGEVEAVGREREYQKAFMTAHPKSQAYMMMGDFGFFRMAVDSARFIGGFGRMSWVDGNEYRDG